MRRLRVQSNLDLLSFDSAFDQLEVDFATVFPSGEIGQLDCLRASHLFTRHSVNWSSLATLEDRYRGHLKVCPTRLSQARHWHEASEVL